MGADLAAMAAAFADVLRRAGIAVTTEQVGRFVRAITLLRPATNPELHAIARVTLVRSPEDLDVFDRAFDQVFGGLADLADSRGDDNAPPPAHTRVDRPPARGGRTGAPGTSESSAAPGERRSTGAADDGERRERELVIAAASPHERLAATDFAELSEDELRDLYDLMARIRLGVPSRRARRHRRHRHGDRLDLRATLRRSRHHGGDPIEHVTRRARQRPRKLVVLCDISGSMAPYSRACVQLLHAAAGSVRAEVFTFGTQLTRLTRLLTVTDPDEAMTRAATSAPDWKGGTRIGSSLKAFLDDFGRRGIARGAVVVIVSDGWERGDPAVVDEQMARLRRLAHRIVWINPRTAAVDFEPRAGGMAAALPYCDDLVSGHTLVALGQAMSSLADAT